MGTGLAEVETNPTASLRVWAKRVQLQPPTTDLPCLCEVAELRSREVDRGMPSAREAPLDVDGRRTSGRYLEMAILSLYVLLDWSHWLSPRCSYEASYAGGTMQTMTMAELLRQKGGSYRHPEVSER